MNQEILVAGATGRTGRIIVHKLIQLGIKPHVLVRDLTDAEKLFGAAAVYHQGDVRKIETLMSSLRGVDAVISTIGAQTPVGRNCPKNVDYQGVANLVEAACRNHIKRFILLSSIAVTRPEHPLNCFGKILGWKLKGEDALRHSGLVYAVIRPGGLKDTPGGKRNLIFDQGDRILGTISREDVADTCLNALQYPHRLQVTFEVVEADRKGQPQWMSLFASLTRD